MPRKRPLGLKAGDVTAHFVAHAQHIPEVRCILLVEAPGEEPRIWTVIDAPPFDRGARQRVYQAQGDALAQGTEVVGFRLINLQELGSALAPALPHGARRLYERDAAA